MWVQMMKVQMMRGTDNKGTDDVGTDDEGTDDVGTDDEWKILSRESMRRRCMMLCVYIYFRDCLFTAAVNSFTSIFSGFVVFSYLGYMADRQHKHIDKVAQEGMIKL